MKFADLFDLEEIQKIQDAFALASGVASIITEPDGTPITKPSNFCRLCSDIIRKSPKGLANCLKSDAQLGRQNPHGPIIQPCLSGGLWDGGAGISVGNVHIANWLIGQVRNETLDDEKLLAYADEIGADKEAYQKALAEVTSMSVEQFENVCHSLFLFANQLSQLAYQNMQLRKDEEVLRKFNQELHRIVKERNIRLDHVSQELGKSNIKLSETMSEREQLAQELDDALGKIKILNGLLPICSKC